MAPGGRTSRRSHTVSRHAVVVLTISAAIAVLAPRVMTMSTSASTDGTPSTSATTPSGHSAAAISTTSATAVLNTLPVKGRAPGTGYSRAQFGPAWDDVDHNGCDTRNDILARDLATTVARPGTRGCIIVSGVLTDLYTARVIHFTRGEKTSTAVQIDHVVALSDAWQTGAQLLTSDQRLRLANDPLNLLAVDGATNEQKSDGDAATWLPPAKDYRCRYVARQVAVKAAYHLWVTPAEKNAIAGVLSTCPGEPVPAH